MSDDPYKAPTVDADKEFNFRPILAIPIGMAIGVSTAIFVMMLLEELLAIPRQAYESVGVPVWFAGVAAGICAALFAMRNVNSSAAVRTESKTQPTVGAESNR